ncbi:MAG: hypothetical protein M3Q72_00730 [Actinomycetota bacterium]|nr:hypothetical protein [Actinomycetota bacterium]
MAYAIAVCAMTCMVPAGLSSAATDDTLGTDDGTDEAYPPDEVIIEVEPPPCEATSINGRLSGAAPSSAFTITVSQDGTVIASDGFTTDGDGNGDYQVALPGGTLGTIVVEASSGTATASATVTIEECPGMLPPTGSSLTGPLLTGGALAVAVGGIIVAATTRRRRAARTGAAQT